MSRSGWAVAALAALLVSSAEAQPGVPPGEPPGEQPAAPPGAPDPKVIEGLIRQLGSDDFREREEATARLKKLGVQALPALEKAAGADDAEISRRAQDLVKDLKPRRDRMLIGPVISGMKVPLAGPYARIEIGDVNGDGQVEGTDLDADELIIGPVNGTARVVLKGKVKRLQVADVNGEAVLDAGGLTAGEVEIGSINGTARVNVRCQGSASFVEEVQGSATVAVAAGGNVRFLRQLDGSTRVDVKAGGGVVLEGPVAAGSRVTVASCRDLFAPRGVGPGARLEATYHGKAEVAGPGGGNVILMKVEPPKVEPPR